MIKSEDILQTVTFLSTFDEMEFLQSWSFEQKQDFQIVRNFTQFSSELLTDHFKAPRPQTPHWLGLNISGQNYALLTSSIRAISEAPGGRPPHRLHQVQEARHQPHRLQRGAGPGVARTGSHPAGSQQMQTPVRPWFWRALQRLHHTEVELFWYILGSSLPLLVLNLFIRFSCWQLALLIHVQCYNINFDMWTIKHI